MKGKTILIIGIIVVAIILVMTLGGGGQHTVEDDPMNIVLDFYDPWVDALRSSSTPYELGLLENPILSQDLRDRITAEASDSAEGDVDPVLCQATAPKSISARPLSDFDGKFQAIVMSAEDELAGQAIVTLTQKGNGWFMSDILCSHGEFAPEEREFSFEKEGFLIKGATASLNPEYWYIVFEEGGQQGHTAPLFFDSTSLCSSATGASFICNPNNLEEASAISVKGQLSELGVEVKRLELGS